MRDIDVLRTELPEGNVQITSDVSYLGEDFFKEFKSLSGIKVDFEDQSYKQTIIKFMRVSWLTSEQDER